MNSMPTQWMDNLGSGVSLSRVVCSLLHAARCIAGGDCHIITDANSESRFGVCVCEPTADI
jgi:hypothetical protein